MRVTAPSLVACIVLGILLAQSWLPVGAGYLGAAIILLAASRLRAAWHKDPTAPDMAERAAQLSGSGTLVCLGFFLAKLYLLGADLDLYSRAARSMAAELWTLIGASLLAQWLARAPAATRDERDAAIASRALASSCWVLLATQLALVLWFSFGQGPGMSIALLAHLLIGSWMIAHVFYDLACMRAYAGARA